MALLVPPGGSAQIGGPTHVDYNGWGTLALQAATALCKASVLCSFLAAAFADFDNCIQGAANALYDATTGVMPDPSQIEGYVQTAKACRQAVADMNEKQSLEENQRAVPDETAKDQAILDEMMAEVPRRANLHAITGVKPSLGEEIGKSLLRVAGE